MGDRLASVRRSIAREEALRASGADPGPQAVERTVSFVCSNQDLLSDEGVRRYLLARSDTLYYHIATKLLDLVVPLHERGYEEEAVRCLRNLVRVHDPEVWDPQGNYLYHLLANKAFKEVLGQERLLVAQPRTWGSLAVETFSALLGARWKASRWEFGVGPDGPDRYCAGWFSEQQLEGEDARWLAGQAVRRALALAAHQPSGETFRALVDGILKVPYTIALNLILQTISDALGDGGQPWLVSEAVRFLTLEEVARTGSTYGSRRMLRRALPVEAVPTVDRMAILQAIREGQTEGFRQCNELSDLEGWDVLSPEEIRGIEGARSSGHLFPPSDPREMPTFVRSEWSESEDRYPAFVSRWPYPDEHPLLSRLQQRESRQPQDAPPPFEGDLGPRLQSLRVVLAHPEAIGDEWLGTTLGYCRHAIEDLIAWFRLSLDNGEKDRPLRLAEVRTLYESHAPWWRIIAEAAVSRLHGPLPENHGTIKTEMLHWGSGDPIYEALQFLDDLLIVESGEPFDAVRQGIERALSDSWAHWPPYTRATALAVLRPFHWATIPGLVRWIDHTLTTEDDPHVLNWCLQTLLRCSNSIADRLRGLIERIAPLPGTEELAQKIGQILGDALIRARGDREGWAELEAVADLADRFISRSGWHDEFRASLASGMMWGASTRLTKTDQLTDLHAQCWLPLARQTLILWLDGRDREENERIPLRPILSVLEREWPDRKRAELLLGLADILERIFLEASIASFFDLHYHLSQQLKGEGTKPGRPIPDEVMIRLCHASSGRVAEWAATKTTSIDMMFSGTVYGRETGELIRLAYQHATNQDLLRRELAPCIDRLHEAGRLDLATELRLCLRRG